MIEIRHSLPNAADLAKRLASVAPNVANNIVRTGALRAAQMLGERMKAILIGNGSVVSGRLLASIEARRSKPRNGYVSAKVGPTKVPYAHLVELGHWHPRNKSKWVRAKPFVGPAFHSSQDQINKTMTTSIHALLSDVLPGGSKK